MKASASAIQKAVVAVISVAGAKAAQEFLEWLIGWLVEQLKSLAPKKTEVVREHETSPVNGIFIPDPPTWWQVLGVPSSAKPDEIRAAAAERRKEITRALKQALK